MMKKRMIQMLICLVILFIIIFGFKAFKGYMMGRYMKAHSNPPVYVSAIIVNEALWQPQYQASANLRAILGVNVTTQLAGMVKEISFIPGAIVKKGDLLVQLDIDPDVASLHALEANADLAVVNYTRDKAQLAVQAVSKAVVDTDLATLKSTSSQVEQQKAIIAQKTIRAPFGGRVGICVVNPGQFLNPGDKVTMLQTLDPIYADFYVPQQFMNKIKLDQVVTLTIDAFPNKIFSGKITTLDPGIDSSVRNVEVEATIQNEQELLAPGMFATVTVNTGQPVSYLTVPQAAVSFNPYGEVVYILKEKGKDPEGKSILTATQRFVKTGEKRGDEIAVLQGLKKGDQVVTAGQLKLKNGSPVIINNSVQPTSKGTENPVDE